MSLKSEIELKGYEWFTLDNTSGDSINLRYSGFSSRWPYLLGLLIWLTISILPFGGIGQLIVFISNQVWWGQVGLWAHYLICTLFLVALLTYSGERCVLEVQGKVAVFQRSLWSMSISTLTGEVKSLRGYSWQAKKILFLTLSPKRIWSKGIAVAASMSKDELAEFAVAIKGFKMVDSIEEIPKIQ